MEKRTKTYDLRCEKHSDKIKKLCFEIIEYLESLPESSPFLYPVDYVAQGLDTYPSIIKRPMDLSTAKEKAESGCYLTLDGLITDLTLIWENCRTFNLDNSVIVKFANKMEANMYQYYKEILSRIDNKESEPISQKKKIELKDLTKNVSSDTLIQFVNIVKDECPKACVKRSEDRLRIKVDKLDRKTYDKLRRLVEDCQNGKPIKKAKIN